MQDAAIYNTITTAVRADAGIINFNDVGLRYLTEDEDNEICTDGQFFMAKSQPYIDAYMQLTAKHNFCNVLELGIFRGGSVVFFDKLLHPARLTAIDLSSTRLEDLDSYVKARGDDRIRLHYGVNQADHEAVVDIVRRDFPDGIDLVIDDASHFEGPTRASFEAIFPHVQPGGVYIIEDWSWKHTAPQIAPEQNDATGVLHELIALHACRGDIIPGITMGPGFFSVQRGWRELGPDFKIDVR